MKKTFLLLLVLSTFVLAGFAQSPLRGQGAQTGARSGSQTASTKQKASHKNSAQANKLPGNTANSREEAPNELELSGRFHLANGTRQGFLIVKARIPDGSYVYSLTQKGDIPPTQIGIKKSEKFQVVGTFAADRTAEVVPFDPIMKSRIEKHRRLVQFYVPIQIAAGVDPQSVKPELVVNTQVCSDQGFCLPIRNRRLIARFGGFFQKKGLRSSNTNGKIR